MDFTRGSAGAPQQARPAATEQPVAATAKRRATRVDGFSKWTRIGSAVLLFAATILIVAMAGLIAFGGGNESKYIDTSKYQAVFLNDGSTSGQSVYFGHIT